jgi:XTP/dITP diphosphohydrolase
MTTLLIATRNEHKVHEIRTMLGSDFRCWTLKEFPGAPEVVEDANTFAGNASKKAVALAQWVSQTQSGPANPPDFVLADDSGLEVDALNGAPGIHSARFAALDTGAPGNSRDIDNNAKLLRLLATVPAEKRTARFRCVLALTPVRADHVESASPVCYANEFELQTQLFEGTCEGRILPAPSRPGGFGYDPLFVPEGHTESFAELGDAVKNGLSHRGKALAKLKAAVTPNSGCPV